MTAAEALISLGQVAAAFAGFSGIVAALGARSVSDLHAATRFRFSNLLVMTVAASLFAFVPIVLGVADLESSTIWALSSVLFGVFTLGHMGLNRSALRRVRAQNPTLLRPWMAVVSVSILALISLALFANAVGWPFGRSGLPYVCSVFGLLVLSGVQFILLALDSASNEPPAV
jgi:hypothetical protein